jgi:hypothetical protein
MNHESSGTVSIDFTQRVDTLGEIDRELIVNFLT